MVQVCIYISHPDLKTVSVTNKSLIANFIGKEFYEVLATSGCIHYNVNNCDFMFRHLESLYAKTHGCIYKEMTKEIEHELSIIAESKALILAFPLYWYSTPYSMKLFMENVLCYKDVLRGKGFSYVMTTGTGSDVYEKGYTGINLQQISLPFKAAAAEADMTFFKPFVYCIGDYQISNFKKENWPKDQLDELAEIMKEKQTEKHKKIQSFEMWLMEFNKN